MKGKTALRRGSFLKSSLALAAAMAGCSGAEANAIPTLPAGMPEATRRTTGTWYVPSELLPHTRTWMAWPNEVAIWGERLLPTVQSNVATIANNIAEFEPVFMICPAASATQVKAAVSSKVTVIDTIPNNDLWMRDMGPIFTTDGRGRLAGLSMNFNGWGNKQVHNLDAKVARRVLAYLGLDCTVTPFVAEGGAIVCDGLGTGLATETSIANPNRNPGKSVGRLSAEISAAYGLTRMLWLPGVIVRGDITDDHVDALANWVPGSAQLVVGQPHSKTETDPFSEDEKHSWELLTRMTDCNSRRFTLHASDCSQKIPPGYNVKTFDNVYMNWYPCNGGVMVPAFDDPLYDRATVTLAKALFRGRKVVQMRIDGLAAGGGGIHCATQPQPVPALA